MLRHEAVRELDVLLVEGDLQPLHHLALDIMRMEDPDRVRRVLHEDDAPGEPLLDPVLEAAEHDAAMVALDDDDDIGVDELGDAQEQLNVLDNDALPRERAPGHVDGLGAHDGARVLGDGHDGRVRAPALARHGPGRRVDGHEDVRPTGPAQRDRGPRERVMDLLLVEALGPRRRRVRLHLALELHAPADIQRLEELVVLLVVPRRLVAPEVRAVLLVAVLDAVLAGLAASAGPERNSPGRWSSSG
jgi:hypothetical protein